MRVDWRDPDDPNYGRTAQVVDLDTGEPIGDCTWADEESGLYEVLLKRDGKFYLDPRTGQAAKKIRQGRIKIVLSIKFREWL